MVLSVGTESVLEYTVNSGCLVIINSQLVAGDWNFCFTGRYTFMSLYKHYKRVSVSSLFLVDKLWHSKI